MGKMPEAQNFLIPPRMFELICSNLFKDIKTLWAADKILHLHEILGPLSNYGNYSKI